MANCMLLHPNRSDAPRGASAGASVSGGGWEPAMPLENVQDRRLFIPAQTVDAEPENTQFDVTMNATHLLMAIVLIKHNLTSTATVKITGWYDENSYELPDYVAFQDAYPSLNDTADLEWEDSNFWDGKPLDEELEGFNQNLIHILPSPGLLINNWRIEIFDEGNPDGYIRFHRLWMSGGWQPSKTYANGAILRYETNTTVEQSVGGNEFFDRKEPYRVHSIGFQYLDRDEALSKGLELCRRAGIDGEIFYIADPDDLKNITRLSFHARLRTLSGWEQMGRFDKANIGFELKENL